MTTQEKKPDSTLDAVYAGIDALVDYALGALGLDRRDADWR